MKRIVLALALVLLVGCGRPAAQPVVAPPVPATESTPIAATAEAAPSPAAPKMVGPNDPLWRVIRASRYTATLHSSTQTAAQFYLYAADERVDVVGDPSCMANTGDTVRMGHYAVYLATSDSLMQKRQDVSPYPEMLLQFNDQRSYLQVVPGRSSGHPDLLVLWQYGSCSMERTAVLALSQDGKNLVHYRFKRADGLVWPTVASRGLEQPAPGQLRTTDYNNATGETTVTTWEVREGEALLEAVQTETKRL
ncbi:MAG: hypothetical protein ACM3XM_00220 [Mycobacterium leprae]